jgi:hypothetical protein
MELQPFTFFARIKLIKKSSNLFEIFKKEGFYFYYFQLNEFYYLFIYGESHLSNSFNNILSSLVVIEELDTKKRKIRSVRGLLLYALEIIKDENLIIVLETNFHPLFWRRLKDVLRQNKQGSLLNFLFESSKSTFSQKVLQALEKMDKRLDRLEKVLKHLNSKSGPEPSFSSVAPSRTTTDELSQRELESANSEALVATK